MNFTVVLVWEIIDEQMYYLDVNYVTQVKVNGKWVENSRHLDTEICKLERFGQDYQDIFSNQPLENYYCIKDIKDLVLEGYSNLERFHILMLGFFLV